MNRRQVLAAGAGVAVSTAFATGAAQAALTTADYDAINKIRTEGLGAATSKVMNIVSGMTDLHGGRLTGSPQAQKAGQWVVDRMKSYGFTGCTLEPWIDEPGNPNKGFPRGWQNDKYFMQATAPYAFPLPGTPTGWTPGVTGSGEAVQVVETAEAELKAKWAGKLKGKWILPIAEPAVLAQWNPVARRYTREQLDNFETPPRTNENGSAAATPARPAAAPTAGAPFNRNAWFLSEGALGVISTVPRAHLVYTAFGANSRADPRTVIPQINIAAEQYGRLARLYKNGTPAVIEADIKNSWTENPLMFNVVGEVRGTDKADEVVILGGHFDSFHAATGATDNAAGCAVMVEALRILKETKVPLRRTVRVCLWTGEEQGLLGSRNYVRAHFGNVRTPPAPRPVDAPPPAPGTPPVQGPMNPPTAEHGKFQVYLNLDNGTGAIRGVFAQGNQEAVPVFRQWMEPFRNIGATHVAPGNTGGTDHQSFDGAGLPGFQFIQDPVDYEPNTHHTNLDFYEALQPEDMRRNATIVAGFAYLAANMDGKFPRKPTTPPPAAPAASAASRQQAAQPTPRR